MFIKRLSLLFLAAIGLTLGAQTADNTTMISRNKVPTTSDRLTPEALWAMGRIGNFTTSPNGRQAVYAVSYYSVAKNKSHSIIYVMDLATRKEQQLTLTNDGESNPTFINNGQQIAFLSNKGGTSQLWAMNLDGSNRIQLTHEKDDVEDFLFSPDHKKVILIKEVDYTASIQKNDADLSKASGMVINEVMYKHWDHYVTSIPHPFVADFNGTEATNAQDILAGEPYECPMLPFGGIEQLAWSPDSKTIAYTCRKKTGKDYAVSTDSDIFLYDLATRTAKNICKPAGYQAPATNDVVSFEKQSVNQQKEDCNVGYDQNPQFSPNGKYVAWTSMERDGYESDRTRLCVCDLSTGKKIYVTESFESGVDGFLWAKDSKSLYFTGVWHATTQIYRTNLSGKVQKLTNDVCDYVLSDISSDGKSLFAKRHSISQADEVYRVTPASTTAKVEQLTTENKAFYDQIKMGDVKERWVSTVDGKKEQCWVIYPPHFDPSKKYPTLLYCEGGPQSPVSQFWSFRWNFQIMAANDYIIIAPNRRGLPGYGMQWLEEISGDYTGLCMKDYLSAIDDICNEPYVDRDRLGCVGASFGGYSVYWLAGHHDKRFKCFIAHDGIYNTQQQYVETDELWFPNWDLGGAPWTAEAKNNKVFTDSPHLSVDKWDAPILCIHGQKDYRILSSQAESAFQAARMRGIPAQLLLMPDENHWVLKPQNGILWQRTFFRWLDRWLKK